MMKMFLMQYKAFSRQTRLVKINQLCAAFDTAHEFAITDCCSNIAISLGGVKE